MGNVVFGLMAFIFILGLVLFITRDKKKSDINDGGGTIDESKPTNDNQIT